LQIFYVKNDEEIQNGLVFTENLLEKYLKCIKNIDKCLRLKEKFQIFDVGKFSTFPLENSIRFLSDVRDSSTPIENHNSQPELKIDRANKNFFGKNKIP
jgi:hypothetical protein